MKSLLCGLLAAALVAGAAPVLAQPAATVEGVQMPAWLERDGRLDPIAPGMALRAGDAVRTGAGSRLLVRLAEGSLVKLGENATLRLAEIGAREGNVFRAALNVLEGAFRFTTQLVDRARRHDVSIRVATVTAGIRGTDLWGRSRDERQIVCLIEGRIEVGADGEKPVTMDQPLQFYQRVKGETQPVGFVDPRQLAEWAKETEIEKGAGAARRGGRFSVVLATADNQADALAMYDRLRAAGYPAEIAPRKEGEKLAYVVRIRGLASKVEADALKARLQSL